MALDNVDLRVSFGEVHAVVGLNGAGKSTLVNVLAGALEPDDGVLRVVDSKARGDGQTTGVSLVPQEIVMVPGLSIGRNALLGSERFFTRADLSRADKERVAGGFERVGLLVDPDVLPTTCTAPELRLVQIARALISGEGVMLLDEPTAVLGHSEADRLLATLSTLRDQGEAIVYVSHRLGEVLEVADRITVMRDGKAVMTLDRGEATRDGLLAILSGGSEKRERSVPDVVTDDEPLLRVERINGPGLSDVDIDVHRGEVVALVGVPAGGQSQMVQTLAGLRPVHSGHVRIDGKLVAFGSIVDSYRSGFVLVPADRRRDGVVASASVLENIVLSPGSVAQRWGIRLKRAERHIVDGYRDSFGLLARSRAAAVATLSGGNQQKVVLAKALEARPRVLLLDEPTQGIDIASKSDILEDIKIEARTSGRGVVAATSQLEEVVGWADTVYVFRLGHVAARLDAADVTEEVLVDLAVP
jgi:ABC-type sugar transport system ATPase subunit